MAEPNFLREFLMVIASYVGVLILAFGILSWMMGGMLKPFLKVKTSRGKLILVHVKGVIQDYQRSGKIDKGFLIFKDKVKDERRIKLPDRTEQKIFIYRSAGVNNINIDDETNSILSIDLTGITGFDAVKYDDLYTRALMKPSIQNKNEKIIIGLLVVLVIIAIVSGFMLFSVNDQLSKLGQVSTPSIVTGGA